MKKIKMFIAFLVISSLISFSLYLFKKINFGDNVKVEEIVLSETSYVFDEC